MSPIPVATLRRIEVLDLRRRMEKVAAFSFDETCNPQIHGEQGRIRERLAFILAIASSEVELVEIYGLLSLARHVYKRSSDVLHGRTNMINLPQVLVDEWRKIIEDVEKLALSSSTENNLTLEAGKSPNSEC
jgi:hypothetical protein